MPLLPWTLPIPMTAVDLQLPIGELLRKYPVLREILEERGIHCVECLVAEQETLLGVAKMHYLDLPDLLAEWQTRQDASNRE